MSKISIEPEYRCDYFVSTDIKKLWNVELGLLEEFERVCAKYNLKYYADGGTLLGAVRHKGFIPWDDDIDIQMMASDYKKLCEVANKEFREPFFFQSYVTEEIFPPWHAKLRDSRTTGCTEFEKILRPMWNKGIFLDIFPLYYVPDNPVIERVQTCLLRFFAKFNPRV